MRRADPIGDRERLMHVLEAIEGIEELLQIPTINHIHERALERYFEIIGEACRHVSKEIKEAYPDIPWYNITALRHIVAHDYDTVEIKTLWDIAEHKIPALKHWITGILDTMKDKKQ